MKLHLTHHTDGTKMDLFSSINTSVQLNENCKRYASKPGSVCASCYANKSLARYKGLAKNLAENTELLTGSILPTCELPRINAFAFRFESFGDLNNEIQVINYFNICELNPRVQFSIWTKNPHIIKRAMEEYGVEKPANLIIIYSIPMVDPDEDWLNTFIGHMDQAFPFIDKYFAVYSKKFASANNVPICCGKKHCIDCMICYSHNNVKVVRELLK